MLELDLIGNLFIYLLNHASEEVGFSQARNKL